MPHFQQPASIRLRELLEQASDAWTSRQASPLAENVPQNAMLLAMANTTMDILTDPKAGASHPDFLNLAGLVCEAVLEVVFVALPGFLAAYTGMFDAHSQKFVAELNTMIFTPCLVFTKLASQLNADTLADLAIIPIIFLLQTLVSWLAAQSMARLFGFGRKKRQKNFILAMGVFGNSNSLPISLVLSLANTISGLHWDRVPGDNDNEVAARGILYLLVFQQLGQLVRWTWGYSVLLKPAAAYEEEERQAGAQAQGEIEEGRYRDDPDSDSDDVDNTALRGSKTTNDSGFSSSPSSISDSDEPDEPIIPVTPANGNNISTSPRNLSPAPPPKSQANGIRSRSSANHITTFPHFSDTAPTPSSEEQSGWKRPIYVVKARVAHVGKRAAAAIATFAANLFRSLPTPLQRFLAIIWSYFAAFMRGVWRQMNPPLWAMLAALIVASIPALQDLFFTPGTLVNNSVTSAITQTGGVAVPLILVVLGANLARSTLPKDQLAVTAEEQREERKLLYASLLSRMVIPTIIMAPILALTAKYVPVSILDDPIFVVVCFLLTGAPSALQLAQICQMNEVFMGAMSNLLVASYVVAIFPSTLTLVLLALEVVKWAA